MTEDKSKLTLGDLRLKADELGLSMAGHLRSNQAMITAALVLLAVAGGAGYLLGRRKRPRE